MRASNTWVCVADGNHAQFMQCDGGRQLEPVMDFGVPQAGTDSFAGRLAGQLDRAERGRCFQHLVLVGPKDFLRELENRLSQPTRDRVVADVVETRLSRATPREASIHLCELLPS